MKHIITSLVVLLSVSQLQAQQATTTPKLVVGIVVDQLRGDYVVQMQDMFGEGGFKRLMREGAFCRNIQFDYNCQDKASAVATIFTGANPWYHGIVAPQYFDREKHKVIPVLSDPEYMGNFTDETVSPRKLMVNTISDELKLATDGFGLVYSFGANHEEAILSGGHAADGAFWIDNRNRRWATSTFYGAIPAFFDKENTNNPLSERLESIDWFPVLAPSQYKFLPYNSKDFTFKYSYKKSKNNIQQYKSSGIVNEEINRSVFQFLKNENLGKRAYPDFLSVNFFAGLPVGMVDNSGFLEIQDTYLRLDKQLELLLNHIDQSVGLKNALVFVVSTGYFDEADNNNEKLKLPTGNFYINRAKALLNMYLMSVYGQGDWVKGYYNKSFYLNQKLIDDKSIDPQQIQKRSADFLMQMSGVQDVTTSFSLLHDAADEHVRLIRNGLSRKTVGDLLVELQPGWFESGEDQTIQSVKIRKSAIVAPLFFIGSGIKPIHIFRTIKATEIAPTISYYLRIRAPNASSGTVIPELY